MKELLQHASTNEYGNTGTTPPPSLAADGETRPYTIAEGSVDCSNIFPEDQQKPNNLTPESSEANQRDKSKEIEGT
jgi:hypothetical protein